MNQREKLLEVRGLVKHFPSGGGIVQAVNTIDFDIYKGETVGLVGESGCGKSTTGRLTLRLLDATEGTIKFEGKNLVDIKKFKELKKLRQQMQMIFQDPYASLDPRRSIGETIGRPLDIHKLVSRNERQDRIINLMEKVGLDPKWINRFPHELDGGRRQRVGIARALALDPKYIVCDEPVSALDVSIQAQVLNLMQDLQEELGLTYLFISHDLSVVKHVSDRIAVMYLGEIVEFATSEEIFNHPEHPYTRALLSAIPVPSIDVKRERIILKGDVPSPKNPPSGCKFHTRCPFAMDICRTTKPELKNYGDNHLIACHLLDQ